MEEGGMDRGGGGVGIEGGGKEEGGRDRGGGGGRDRGRG